MESKKQGLNWLDLPREVSLLILSRLGAIDILTSAQNVCSSWFNICKDPLLWRTIDMRHFNHPWFRLDLEKMCRCAIDRSCGHLVEIILEDLATNELLKYIGDSSSQVKRIQLIGGYFSNDGLGRAAFRLPMLEELDLSRCTFSKRSLKLVGRRCHLLKSLTLSSHYTFSSFFCHNWEIDFNEEAIAIAKFMPELRRLKLSGNRLSYIGLQAILDGCPHLESLDVRSCYNINIGGDTSRISGIEFLYDKPERITNEIY